MSSIQLLPTDIPNLDAVLGGGVPVYSLNMLAGPPGSGKTILAQQLLFNHSRLASSPKAFYLTTMSEPITKITRYMQQFRFFDAKTFGDLVRYHDLGRVLRERPLPDVTDYILQLVEVNRPEIIVIDSFRAIRDISYDLSAFRRFCYDLSVRLSSARCTAFLVGEYDRSDVGSGPEFAVADGIVYLGLVLQEGEERRFLQVLKLRGRSAEMTPFPFAITSDGIRVFSSSLSLRQAGEDPKMTYEPMPTGIEGIDRILEGGIPRGYCIIWSGVSGTGKTTSALQSLVHGTQLGEKGIMFSFEEHPDRLHRTAAGFGWDLADLERRDLLRIIFIPPDTIRVDENLEEMIRVVQTFQPQRFVIDSFSVLLHKVLDPAVQREKTFQMATLARRTGSICILVSDIPSNTSHGPTRFGVEETVADGTIVLTAEMEDRRRKRYLEVYKMRAVSHVSGRHRMEITNHGVEVFYAGGADLQEVVSPPPLSFTPVRDVLQGDLPYGSAWLVQGEPGIGKSTIAYQFAIDGLRRKNAVLYIAADSPAALVRRSFQGFGFLPDPYIEAGYLTILETFGRGPESLDPTDGETFIFGVLRHVGHKPKPLRVVFDSLTPLALGYTPSEFIVLVHRLIRSLRRPDVTIFSTILEQTLSLHDLSSLFNAFDIVVDLFSPNWGEMQLAGNVGYRALRVRKARGVGANTQPLPYTISPTEGIIVHNAFYV